MPLFLQDINLTFDHDGDEMPHNRVKILHATGVTALFKYVNTYDHAYTGSLKGTEYGVFRISEVGSARGTDAPATSAGFKFLRDGVAAGTMLTVHAFDGHEETFNFLRPDIDYNTHVDLPEDDCRLMTVSAKLAQASDHIGNMSVKNLSDYDQYGNREHNPNWPFKMRLIPNDVCGAPDTWSGAFFDYLPKCVKSGTKLFDVFAQAQPDGQPGGEEHQIGEIIMTSRLTKSLWGDTRLFFKHFRFEEDLAARPQWTPHVEDFERDTGLRRFHESLPLPPRSPNKCPFDWMFGLM